MRWNKERKLGSDLFGSWVRKKDGKKNGWQKKKKNKK